MTRGYFAGYATWPRAKPVKEVLHTYFCNLADFKQMQFVLNQHQFTGRPQEAGAEERTEIRVKQEEKSGIITCLNPAVP